MMRQKINIGATARQSITEVKRYLAAVAYLDGIHPSIVMCRGYYHDSVIRAYTWDGTELTMQWGA